MRILSESVNEWGQPVLLKEKNSKSELDGWPFFHSSNHPETPTPSEKERTGVRYFDPFGVYLFISNEPADSPSFKEKKYCWGAKLKSNKGLWNIDSMGQSEAWKLLNDAGIKTVDQIHQILKDRDLDTELFELDHFEEMLEVEEEEDPKQIEKNFWENYFTNGYAASAAYRILKGHFRNRAKFTNFLKAHGFTGVYDSTGAMWAGEPQAVIFDPKNIEWSDRKDNKACWERSENVNQWGQPVPISESKFYPNDIIDHHLAHTSVKIQDHVRKLILSYPEWEKKSVPIKEIEPRSTIDFMVDKYSNMKNDPPAVILIPSNHDGYGYESLDGAHRISAAAKNGKTEIIALVPIGNRRRVRGISF